MTVRKRPGGLNKVHYVNLNGPGTKDTKNYMSIKNMHSEDMGKAKNNATRKAVTLLVGIIKPSTLLLRPTMKRTNIMFVFLSLRFFRFFF